MPGFSGGGHYHSNGESIQKPKDNDMETAIISWFLGC